MRVPRTPGGLRSPTGGPAPDGWGEARPGAGRWEELVSTTESLAGVAGRIEAFARARLSLPGLAVGLVGPGGWHHEFAVGVADVASGRPLEPAALMPIASIGKAMTAVALLREQEAGRIDLDDPVHDQLPWLPLATPFGPITVAHLLAHTAGIVAGMEGSPSPVAEALALAATSPGWPPGERASYSNVGYSVLGLVLERVAGCSYGEAIQRHVLDPGGMTASEPVTRLLQLRLRLPRDRGRGGRARERALGAAGGVRGLGGGRARPGPAADGGARARTAARPTARGRRTACGRAADRPGPRGTPGRPGPAGRDLRRLEFVGARGPG